MLDKSRVRGHPAGGIGPACNVVRIRDHIRVQKKQIEPRQVQACEASFDRLPQERPDFPPRRVAEITFAGDAQTVRQVAAESFADNLFGLAIRHGLTANDLKATMFAYPTGASDIGSMV